MDVEVDQTRGKGRLQSIRGSLLGDGLLERARATTLGLLGGAAAVGLAMLALVFNQGWPLVAGGPVPPLPPREQAVAKAKVVAAKAHGQAASVAGVASRRHDSGGDGGGSRQGPTPETGATQAPSDELVVAPAAQVEGQGDAPPSGPHARPAPAKPDATPAPPTQTEAAPQTQTGAEAAEQTPAPPPAQTPPPTATVSEAPESSVPSWSNGKGHAYGRSGREDDD
jgi:hypothetical protein